MVKIQQLSGGPDFCSEVESGIELLLQHRHLLDQADVKQRWAVMSGGGVSTHSSLVDDDVNTDC